VAVRATEEDLADSLDRLAERIASAFS
jgi:hypothetical protein